MKKYKKMSLNAQKITRLITMISLIAQEKQKIIALVWVSDEIEQERAQEDEERTWWWLGDEGKVVVVAGERGRSREENDRWEVVWRTICGGVDWRRR